MNDESCCLVSCDKPLDQDYWDAQYKAKTTGWDLGLVSPPIKNYIDTLKDKDIAILIPGCGNTYEAAYLLEQGFTNVTVIDIAPTLVKIIEQKFIDNTCIQVLLGDFFSHKGEYDLIIEQTFFLRFTAGNASKIYLENAGAFSKRRNAFWFVIQ